MMLFDGMSIMAYAVGLILVYLLCWIFIRPLKWIFKLGINSVLGGFMLAAVNLVGGFMGMHISINPLTALISGVLGVPGMGLIIALQYIL